MLLAVAFRGRDGLLFACGVGARFVARTVLIPSGSVCWRRSRPGARPSRLAFCVAASLLRLGLEHGSNFFHLERCRDN